MSLRLGSTAPRPLDHETRLATPSNGGAVVVGAPDFGEGSALATGPAKVPDTSENANRQERSADMRARAFPPLLLAAEVARTIHARLGNATLLLGPRATEGAVKALHGPRVLHIATHGFFLLDQTPIERVLSIQAARVLGIDSRPACVTPKTPCCARGLRWPAPMPKRAATTTASSQGTPVLLGQLHRVGQSRSAGWHACGARFCQAPARTAGLRVRAGERRADACGCMVGSHGGARDRADAQEPLRLDLGDGDAALISSPSRPSASARRTR
jgi:hypothetical protein